MNDFERIAHIIRYLDQHHTDQPTLVELAELVGLSPYHFHRLFTRWAGVTPKDFLQCLTLGHLKDALEAGKSVLDATYDAGLSSPGRAHDLCVNLEAASPGEIKSGGEGWSIEVAWGQSPFGPCLVGQSPRGICHLSFVDQCHPETAFQAIQNDWPNADLTWAGETAGELLDGMFAPRSSGNDLRAVVGGSKFQVRVWQALLHIPMGDITTYSRVAAYIGERSAARAVGTAVGQNPLAYLIPCHRVIRETGIIGEYRWGAARKKAIIGWEQAGRRRGS